MSSEGQSPEDKTEEPTAKRLEDARKKGQVPHSKELNTSIILIVGAAGTLFFGQYMMTSLIEIMTSIFTFNRDQLYMDNAMLALTGAMILKMIILLLPLFSILFLAAFVGPFFLNGFRINFSSIAPKFSRMSPLAGLKRIFSMKGIVELVKALGKFLLLSLCATLIVYYKMAEIMTVSNHDPDVVIWHGINVIAYSFVGLSATTLIITMLDVPYQLYEYMKQMRMTKQEVRDEYKEQEGSQEVKSKVRQMQRKFAESRMMNDIPTADVIITNPTHYAVALRYDEKLGGAPVVMAKGKDFIAEQIKKVALHHKIAIVSSPPLARSIFFTTEIREEIPAGLYVAVAQILAYIYQLKRYNEGRGIRPEKIPEVDIPVELQHEG